MGWYFKDESLNIDSLSATRDANWNTCTLTTTQVGSGSKAVILRVYNDNSSTAYKCNVRHYGSTGNTREPILGGYRQTWLIVPLDSTLRFDYLFEHADLKVELIAYCDTGTWQGGAYPDKSIGTTGSYQTVDYDANLPDGAAIAFCEHYDTSSSSYQLCYTENDSILDQYNYCYGYSGYFVGHVIQTPTTSHRYAEGKIGNAALDLYLIGYETGDNFSKVAPSPLPFSPVAVPGTGWNRITASEAVDGASGVLLLIINNDAASAYNVDLQKVAGASLPFTTPTHRILRQQSAMFMAVGLNTSKQFDIYAQDTDIKYVILGSFLSAVEEEMSCVYLRMDVAEFGEPGKFSAAKMYIEIEAGL